MITPNSQSYTEVALKSYYQKELGHIVGSLSTPQCADKLLCIFDQAKKLTEYFGDLSNKNNLNWRPTRDWDECTGDSHRTIKFLKEEVLLIARFFRQYNPDSLLECIDGSQGYDAILVNPEMGSSRHIEVCSPRDGRREFIEDSEVTEKGFSLDIGRDFNLGFERIRPRIEETIRKKSVKRYPPNTLLIIEYGSHFPTNFGGSGSAGMELYDNNSKKLFEEIADWAATLKFTSEDVFAMFKWEPYWIKRIK